MTEASPWASTVGVAAPAAAAASRRSCRRADSILSKNRFMRCCRRSFSNTSASPTITRVMPGFFSPNCSSRPTSLRQRASGSDSRSASWPMRPNTDCSMNSIRPSNIWALLAKWRYSAASLTSRRAARAAVVTRSAPGCSSMVASACRICTRRSPGRGRLRPAAGASASASTGAEDSDGRDVMAGDPWRPGPVRGFSHSPIHPLTRRHECGCGPRG